LILKKKLDVPENNIIFRKKCRYLRKLSDLEAKREGQLGKDNRDLYSPFAG
jgi:hypothetical protein